MSQSDKINLNSLNIVSDELVVAIEQAAARLEQFVAAPDNEQLAQECDEAIRQIAGTFRMIQLHGADILADAMADVLGRLRNDDGSVNEACLGVLTNAFFVLPRYLEYVQQNRHGLPVLLIPDINELRQQSRQPAIPESRFFQVNCQSSTFSPRQGSTSLEIEDFESLIRRFRHMYQVGLLSALQGKQVRSALGIMQRALERLEIISGGRPMAVLWSLAGIGLEVLRTNNMELNKSRRMLLTAIDREIKALQKNGSTYLESSASEALVAQLLFVIALAHRSSDKVREVLAAFDVPAPGYSDQDLCRERESLRGPSGNTVASVAAVISDEISSIKENLELVSENKHAGDEECGVLIGGLTKVADILSVVGLASASSSLQEQIPKIESWRDSQGCCDTVEMIEVADALLFVESTLAGLESLNLSSDKLSKINSLARREVIANSQLAEAEMLVIREAEAGLSLVKRGLNSFAESNYDYGHIKNVGTILNGVRGGLIVLSLKKAAAVVEGCIDFVEQTLLAPRQPEALHQLLETFADAIIGLEYYLESIRFDRQADDSVLFIAEESLQALGYRVRIPASA